jgi:RHS repeat-associated protein
MTVDNNTLDFAYDANGAPMTVTYNGTTYYYVTNLQGDVVAILNSAGTAVATYSYEAWGGLLFTGGTMEGTLGDLNPLRYRGYVFDNETGLYYLQSRYYNPGMGRFINADNFMATGQGFIGNNPYVYCGNNPVLNYDPSGNFFFAALGAAAGFIGGAVAGALSGQSGHALLETAVHSAVGGAIGGAGVDAALLIIGSCGTAFPAVALAGGVAFMAGGVGNTYTTYASSGGKATDAQMIKSFFIGGTANLVSLGTSMGSVASNVDGLFVAGMNQFTSNMTTGVMIATGASIATNVATSTYTPPTTSKPGKTGQSNSVSSPVRSGYAPGKTKYPGGIIITMGKNSNSIVVPTVGRNLRVR